MLLSRCLVLLMLFTGFLFGQEKEEPIIGLVLSGGGARGFAHVGVLRALEEMRVPIHRLTGTSMGSVVGGLYSSGLNIAELEHLVLETDWDAIFKDDPARVDRPFRRKQDDRAYLIDLDLGMRNWAFTYPRGLIQGQKLLTKLQKLTLPVALITDFDQLPLPFRALAADIETGEQVVLGEGNLAKAIRASMSVPFAFEPLLHNGRLLVDGGIANNMPIDVAREMGANALVVVDIGMLLKDAEQLDSSLAIVDQLGTLLVRSNADQQMANLEAGDIYMLPDLQGFTSTSFSDGTQIMEAGYQATMAKREELKALAVSEEDYRLFRAKMDAHRGRMPTIRDLSVEQDSRLSPAFFRSQMRTAPGQLLDPEQLMADIQNIYGYDYYELVDFELQGEWDQAELRVKARKKSWGPNFLKFGLSLEEDFTGDSDFGLSFSLIKTQINRLGGEWRLGAVIGSRPFYETRFYQPLSARQTWYVEPFLDFRRNRFPVIYNVQEVGEIKFNSTRSGFHLGRHFGKTSDLQLTSAYFWDTFDTVVAGENEQGKVETREMKLSYTYDSLDKPYLPRSGTYLRGSVAYLRFSDPDEEPDALEPFGKDNRTWEWLLEKPITRGKYTLSLGLELATVGDDDSDLNQPFFLGGLFRLSGYEENQFFGYHSGLARLLFFRQVRGNTSARYNRGLYMGGSLEAGRTWFERDDVSTRSLLYSGSLWAAMDTFLGPIYLAVGVSEDDVAYYLTIGRTLSFR